MTEHNTESSTFGRDTRPAFMGLIIGAIVLFLILGAIVKMTAAKYSHESPAAATR